MKEKILLLLTAALGLVGCQGIDQNCACHRRTADEMERVRDALEAKAGLAAELLSALKRFRQPVADLVEAGRMEDNVLAALECEVLEVRLEENAIAIERSRLDKDDETLREHLEQRIVWLEAIGKLRDNMSERTEAEAITQDDRSGLVALWRDAYRVRKLAVETRTQLGMLEDEEE